MKRAGILGASGYVGLEILRLLDSHPGVEVAVAGADSNAGALAAGLYPSLGAAYPDLVFGDNDPGACDGLDVVFLALPHEVSLDVVPRLLGRVGCVVDLSAAYRLRDPAAYPQWYGFEHTHPELLHEARYGLPEVSRAGLPGASLVATPGCYVTAAALALTPLVEAGVIDPTDVIVDAASGVSGAGRALRPGSLFCEVEESLSVYGLVDHRHTPEMEQVTGATILFTPHLAPMNRGILATCYARPAAGRVTSESVLACLADRYRTEPFVVVHRREPATKSVLGTNSAHLTARHDPRTGRVVVVCAIDNLTKGAAGGAVQSANLALGLPETDGLARTGLWP